MKIKHYKHARRILNVYKRNYVSLIKSGELSVENQQQNFVKLEAAHIPCHLNCGTARSGIFNRLKGCSLRII